MYVGISLYLYRSKISSESRSLLVRSWRHPLRCFLHNCTTNQELKFGQNFRALIRVFSPISIMFFLVPDHVFIQNDEVLVADPSQIVDLRNRLEFWRLVVQNRFRHHRPKETSFLLNFFVEETVTIYAQNSSSILSFSVNLVDPKFLEHWARDLTV